VNDAKSGVNLGQSENRNGMKPNCEL
jgi:hypothetical protein